MPFQKIKAAVPSKSWSFGMTQRVFILPESTGFGDNAKGVPPNWLEYKRKRLS
jgi:hypothetical protein